MKQIKVLVVDDSVVFRQMVSQAVDSAPDMTVVAMAADPFQARDMILRFEPDVMTLDVEMPKMSGIEFLRKLMPQYPLPTVMLSSLNSAVFDALAAGAVDFVNKPQNMRPDELNRWVEEELLQKIRAAVVAKVGGRKPAANVGRPVAVRAQAALPSSANGREYKGKILAIGASTGGTEAIYNVVKDLHNDIPGTVMVQHMPPGFTKMYAERLHTQCEVSVKEAEDGDLVERGKILLAPGDKQMRLVKTGGVYRVEVKDGEKVSGHRPSVDVLFDSVAKVAGSNALGVILTGMGADGAKGLLAMHKSGARTLGQDEKTCVVYGMPKVAFDIGAVEKQVPLERMAGMIYSVLNSMP